MESLPAQLTQLESAHLVRRLAEEELAYLFKHALTQQATYNSLLLKKRRELHQRIAQVYEALDPKRLDEYAALLVYHYKEAGDHAKVFEYAVRAGAIAAQVYAHTEARAYFAQALDAMTHLSDNDENRGRHVDVLIEYIKLAWAVEPIPHMLQLCAEAEQLVQKLVDSVGLSPDNLARLATIHYSISSMHMIRNELPLALDYYHRSLEEAQAINAVELVAFICAFVGLIKTNQGHLPEAEEYLAQGWAVLSQAPDRWESNICLGSYGLCLALRGHSAAMLPQLETARARLEADHNVFSLLPILNYISSVRLWRGDIQLASAANLNLVALAEKAGDFFYLCFPSAFQALIMSRTGQNEAAEAELARAKSIRERVGGRILFDDWIAAIEAEIALNAKRADKAQVLAEQAVRVARSVDSIFAKGWAQRVWGQALAAQDPPRWDEADAHLEASVRLFEAGDAMPDAARTRVAWGEMLMRRGQKPRALEHFEQAAVQYENSGLTAQLEQVRMLLERAAG